MKLSAFTSGLLTLAFATSLFAQQPPAPAQAAPQATASPSATPSPTPRKGPIPTYENISYGADPNQVLDIYLPPNGKGPFGVLVWYGGIWKPGRGVPDVNRFLPHNIAMVAVQTRVMADGQRDKVSPPVSVVLMDAVRCVQFLRLNAEKWNLDPNRIGVAGGSQGGLPAAYAACAGEKADPNSSDPVERTSSKIVCAGAYRAQPTFDPLRLREWAPGIVWGVPALGCSFDQSLERRQELLPLIEKWAPDAIMTKDMAPMYFENEWGLTKPEDPKITEVNYIVHCPQIAIGFQKIAKERGATCYIKYLGHDGEGGYRDIWHFLVEMLKAK